MSFSAGQYLTIFNAINAEHSAAFLEQYGLQIKTGEALGAAILKLIKPQWTTDEGEGILNNNGLFFGLWVDADCEAKGIVRYNLHAKKLREIMGQNFAAREFVRSCRLHCKDELANWPNWSYPKGPITVFEGHFALNDATLQDETLDLMHKFTKIAPLVEKQLG